jgi:hypothetical protein
MRSFHKFITTYLKPGKTILELGSGDGDKVLVDAGYIVYAVEHDTTWLNRYEEVNYIYAPLKAHKAVAGLGAANIWYDPAYLKDLPEYDLLIIDGPPGCEGRSGFYKYQSLFNLNVPIIFDDAQRSTERRMITRLAGKLNRNYVFVRHIPKDSSDPWDRTPYVVFLPDGWDWKPYEPKREKTKCVF